jgi:cytochrome c peroxidase
MRSSSTLRHAAIALMVCAGFVLQTGQAFAGDDFTYIGSGKCKICHRKEADGAQYPKWESSAHAKAFETLGTPEAAEVAKKAGIEGSPQEAAACLKCHATAAGLSKEALADTKLTMEEGVSCESCHGPGSAYWKKSTMQAVADGETKPETVGLVIPNAETCTACHNEDSPTFKGFDFDEYAAKIAHPIPDK